MYDEIKRLRLDEMSPWDPIPKDLEAMFPQVLSRMKHDDLSHAIGRFVVMWAHLESSLNVLIYKLVKLSDNADFFAFSAILSGTDIYKKADALVAIGARIKPNNTWFNDLHELQKKLSGPLREKRNRIVHDLWLTHRDVSERVTYKARYDTKSGRPEVASSAPVTASEITKSTITITLCVALVTRLHKEFVISRGEG